jgi:hypothetical protein
MMPMNIDRTGQLRAATAAPFFRKSLFRCTPNR